MAGGLGRTAVAAQERGSDLLDDRIRNVLLPHPRCTARRPQLQMASAEPVTVWAYRATHFRGQAMREDLPKPVKTLIDYT